MTIQQEIATSVSEVESLLESNAKLSISFLALTMNQLKRDIERRNQYTDRKIHELERENTALKERLNKAGESFRDLEKKVDTIRDCT